MLQEHCKWFRIRPSVVRIGLAVVQSVDARLTDARSGRHSIAPTDENIESCVWPVQWRPFRLRSKHCRMFKLQQLYRLHDCWDEFWKSVHRNCSWFVSNEAETVTECVMSRFLSMAEDGRKIRYRWEVVVLCVQSWNKASEYGVDGKKYWHYRWKVLFFIIFAQIIYGTLPAALWPWGWLSL